MLSMICDQFMKQNFELYLKHELMLDDEKQKRADLAVHFQEKMGTLSNDINSQKNERQSEYEQNQQLREKIQKAIDEYKVKEEDYKSKMELFNSKIQGV